MKCKEKQRELHRQLLKGAPEESCPGFLINIWNEFQVNHKERKIKQSLELVKRLDSGLQDAQSNILQRIETFGEVKKHISATLNPDDPLNIDDYEPPHEQAIASLRAIARGVLKSQRAWESDLRNLERAFEEDNPLGDLRKEQEESAAEVRRSGIDLDAAQEEVRRCWDALMEAQKKCTRAEKTFVAAKVQVLSPLSPSHCSRPIHIAAALCLLLACLRV